MSTEELLALRRHGPERMNRLVDRREHNPTHAEVVTDPLTDPRLQPKPEHLSSARKYGWAPYGRR